MSVEPNAGDFAWMARLPFRYGQIVYHVTAREKKKGVVVGYQLRPGSLVVLVTWDGPADGYHFPFELTTEFEPDLTSE